MTNDAARDAVARLVWTCWNWEPSDTPWEQLTDEHGGKIDARAYADLILAKLLEMGWKDGATIAAMLSSRLRLEYIGPSPETGT